MGLLPRLYIWVLGKRKTHCVTCAAMAGTVGTWGSFGLRPKVHAGCGCGIVPLPYELQVKEKPKWYIDLLRSEKLGALNERRLEMYERQRESAPGGETGGAVGLEMGSICYPEDDPAVLLGYGEASIGVEEESMLWNWDDPWREEWC